MEKGYQIPGESVASLRKDLEFKAIYDALVPQDKKAEVDLKFEQIMSQQIDSIEKQVEQVESQGRVRTLLQGVPGVMPADIKNPKQ